MRRLRVTPAYLIALIATVLQMAGCNPPDELTYGISGQTGPMYMGSTRQFHASFLGVSPDSIAWVVPDPAAGRIDSTGRFTAGLTAGSFPIIARAPSADSAADTISVAIEPWGPTTAFGHPAYGVAVNKDGVVGIADLYSPVVFYSGATSDSVSVPGGPVHLAFDLLGTHAFVVGLYGTLTRLDVAGPTVADSLYFARGLYNIAIRPTDSVLYVTSNDGWLFKVAPDPLAKLDSVQLASASNGLAFTPSGAQLWVATLDTGRVYRIDPVSLAKLDSFDLGPGTQRVAVDLTGDSVYVANQGKAALQVILPRLDTVVRVDLQSSAHGVALSSDRSKVYVAPYDGPVVVLDRATLKVIAKVPVGGHPRNIAPVPYTDAMVVTTEGDVVRIN